MSARVKLEVLRGPRASRNFLFEAHDTFLFGRGKQCHYSLRDPFLSRHHFLLEINPPQARIKDLGSLNGTIVNGVQYGGPSIEEKPEGVPHEVSQAVDLNDGDIIKVGKTEFLLKVEPTQRCAECCEPLVSEESTNNLSRDNAPVSAVNEVDEPYPGKPDRNPDLALCQACGKDVSAEVGAVPPGFYLCRNCRQEHRISPWPLVLDFVRRYAARSVEGELEQQILDYAVERELARGSLGVVYLARNKKEGSPAAIKVLLSQVAVHEYIQKTFMREINLMNTLQHTNIVPLFRHGSAGSLFYFIMEYCEGGSVRDRMNAQGGKLAMAEFKRITTQALSGLAEVHFCGFVHRDMKPENILLKKEGNNFVAKIADFGIAKPFLQAGLSGITLNEKGGTYEFMPPEQYRDYRFPKPPTDVWSMGATMYNMLTGCVPHDFPDGEPREKVVLDSRIVPIRERDPNVPEQVAALIDKALAYKPEERYACAGEMRDALSKVLA